MSRGLAIRSVQLSVETTNAWKEVNIRFARRGRTTSQNMGLALGDGYDFVLNLGKSEFSVDESGYMPKFIWNNGPNILPLLYPGFTRELLGDMMPPQPQGFPADVWIKAPGMKGKGKYKKAIDRRLHLPREWDWQEHIVGTEYRVLTVGDRVVQSFIKEGDATTRDYTWVGLEGTPREVKRKAREAAKLLDGSNVVGWDIVEEDSVQRNVYIFEGNSCPGVNYATASRIKEEIDRQMEEAA